MTSGKTSANFIELLNKLTFGFTFRNEQFAFKLWCFLTSRNSWAAIRPVLKNFLHLETDFWTKKYISLHSNSRNVSLVSLCVSFDAFTAFTAFVLFNQSNRLAILKSKARIVQTLFAYQFKWGCKFEGNEVLTLFALDLHFFASYLHQVNLV